MVISPQEYLLVIMIGAALVALWFVIRFPKLTPAKLWVAALHAIVALAIGPIVVENGPDLFTGLPVPNALVIAVVLGMLPPATYIFLSMAWLIQNLQRRISAPF
jgi:hypothetical protein